MSLNVEYFGILTVAIFFIASRGVCLVHEELEELKTTRRRCEQIVSCRVLLCYGIHFPEFCVEGSRCGAFCVGVHVVWDDTFNPSNFVGWS